MPFPVAPPSDPYQVPSAFARYPSSYAGSAKSSQHRRNGNGSRITRKVCATALVEICNLKFLFVFARLLVTWNRAVFEEFLPTTWAALLRTLVKENEVEDIWSAWPALEATNGSGYWSQILPNLMKRVLDLDLSVFPAFPNAEHYVSLSSALIASESDEVVVLRALTNVGLALVRLPRHLQSALPFASRDLLLHPTRVSNALMVCSICGNCGEH